MNNKLAEKELDYRIAKIVLATMFAKGIISHEEYETARRWLIKKIQPPIGSLEPPNGA